MGSGNDHHPERAVGRRLARLRRRSGVTQHRLSAETGIGLTRLVFFETGRCDLEPQEIENIHNFLKARVARLANEIAKPYSRKSRDRFHEHRHRHN